MVILRLIQSVRTVSYTHLDLLKKNAMKEQANDVFEICSYVDGLEKKIDSMTEELTNMQNQIKDCLLYTSIDRVETAVEALNVSVNEFGYVNPAYMLSIYEPDITNAKEELAEKSGQTVDEICLLYTSTGKYPCAQKRQCRWA